MFPNMPAEAIGRYGTSGTEQAHAAWSLVQVVRPVAVGRPFRVGQGRRLQVWAVQGPAQLPLVVQALQGLPPTGPLAKIWPCLQGFEQGVFDGRAAPEDQ